MSSDCWFQLPENESPVIHKLKYICWLDWTFDVTLGSGDLLTFSGHPISVTNQQNNWQLNYKNLISSSSETRWGVWRRRISKLQTNINTASCTSEDVLKLFVNSTHTKWGARKIETWRKLEANVVREIPLLLFSTCSSFLKFPAAEFTGALKLRRQAGQSEVFRVTRVCCKQWRPRSLIVGSG